MNDDENHPEYLAVRNALFGQLAMMAAHEPFTKRLMERLQELCDSATRQARQRGLDFPDMIVLYFKPSRLVRIYRRDADKKLLDMYIRILIKEAPELGYRQLRAGFKRGFPAFNIDDFLMFKFNIETGERYPSPNETKQ